MDLVLALIGTGPGIMIIRYFLQSVQIWLIEERLKMEEKQDADN
jgi:hypothetical protein